MFDGSDQLLYQLILVGQQLTLVGQLDALRVQQLGLAFNQLI